VNSYPEEIAESMSPDELDELKEELGFTVEELTDSIRRQLNLRSGIEGVVISEISQASNAYRQGLRRGDVVMQVADERVVIPISFTVLYKR
jgi:serine protease Do